MRFWKFSATVGLSIATTVSWGQSPREADPDRALRQLEAGSSEDGIPADVRATIINKPRIAEETLQRVVGLREAKNPHIQRGEGLFLAEIQDNPQVSQVDLEALRKERIALYEGRLDKLSPGPESGARAEPSGKEKAPAPAGPASIPKGGYGGLIFAGVLLGLGCVAGCLVWQKSRK